MNTHRHSRTVRIAAATASGILTVVLFSAVISASEPQRSQLAALIKSDQAGESRLATAQVAMRQQLPASR
jgi:hypothetical protein